MAQTPEISYAIHKSSRTSGLFMLGFDNLTKAEAAEYLLLLDKHQRARGELRSTAEQQGMTTDDVAKALGVDPFAKPRSQLRPALPCEERGR